MSVRAALCSAVMLLSLPARAETPTEWIDLGARVHGAFGAFIPIREQPDSGWFVVERVVNPKEPTL